MSTPGRNSPCPCGSGKKVKRCHPDGMAGPRWSLVGPAGRPSALTAGQEDERVVHDPEILPAEAPDETGGHDFGTRTGHRERVRVQAPPPGPEGLRISREILDGDLAPGDFEAIRVALNGKIQSLRAVELARAQASIRVGMRVTYPGRFGPVEGVVHDIRRTRAVVCSEGDSWMVSLGLLRPVPAGSSRLPAEDGPLDVTPPLRGQDPVPSA